MENEMFLNQPENVLRPIDKNRSIKSATAEPEMEDLIDNQLMKVIVQELGLNEEAISSLEPLAHRNTKDCVHCKMVVKIESLQNDIRRMNLELQTTNQILTEKKKQNGEMTSMIKRLEENLGDDQENRTRSINCSCFNKCLIF
jgi:hypothetical protein